MDVNEFDYYLPEKLIAQQPVPNRDESRLMVLDKATGEIEDRIFKDIIDLLDPGDLLVMNNSRVIPARLYGKKVPTGTDIEVLLLTEKEEGVWEVLVRPGKRVKKGVEISFGDNELMAKAVEYTEFGGRIMEFSYQGKFNEIIERLGELPLPPYIHEKLAEPGRYQTVYARKPGSAAAPTAGLHFTPQLIKQLEEKGIDIAYITLHVGLGTFRPVKVDKVEEHQMHSEYYELDAATARLIKEKKESGKRVISVGTTVTRTLETIAAKGEIAAKKGWTDIFIYPPYKFKVIDGLITNFHLPRSTLLMLVSAFAGKEKVLTAYKEAVNREYRFFSLGDAMFIK
ncbi:tRNA preQ1(34) S-adenosylmethionine ribosyltransferase-isomerase QueA [Iocasia frigidifontis]|uniref:S-adenosylmethionine:tRNA ribosyltransferase-isomerase n=1 Tax=Iocasia fonsfrigidae TaxID=2682810 RepID=A0A8A7K8C6_9FIRM|nr:tRNA preQ1(34) S-adenosylmethionine ribosyltransferase-isomerase QueA [Iocasia fonsfrigidae]QTL97996.1 tRNA preQ1(34) S-adenosylmethionine ribosyltransferase-isomerase QueA [Iocasia fonsfrigidae]